MRSRKTQKTSWLMPTFRATLVITWYPPVKSCTNAIAACAFHASPPAATAAICFSLLGCRLKSENSEMAFLISRRDYRSEWVGTSKRCQSFNSKASNRIQRPVAGSRTSWSIWGIRSKSQVSGELTPSKKHQHGHDRTKAPGWITAPISKRDWWKL